MTARRIVVVAEHLTSAEGNSQIERRTVVFDENVTLKEVFAWLRYENAEAMTRAVHERKWWDARLSIHEDEATRPKTPFERDWATGLLAETEDEAEA